MESNPIVQWVEKKVGDGVHFLRVNLHTPCAKEIMARYEIPINSAYVVFDRQGEEIWRSYGIPLNGRKALRILRQAVENR